MRYLLLLLLVACTNTINETKEEPVALLETTSEIVESNHGGCIDTSCIDEDARLSYNGNNGYRLIKGRKVIAKLLIGEEVKSENHQMYLQSNGSSYFAVYQLANAAYVKAIDKKTGGDLWTLPVAGAKMAIPLLTSKDLFVVTDKEVVKIDISEGSVSWRQVSPIDNKDLLSATNLHWNEQNLELQTGDTAVKLDVMDGKIL